MGRKRGTVPVVDAPITSADLARRVARLARRVEELERFVRAFDTWDECGCDLPFAAPCTASEPHLSVECEHYGEMFDARAALRAKERKEHP